jgi:hypothetical protein
MLLYVDKKKEKQQRIKRIVIVFLCILFLLLNILQFYRSLHQAEQQLSSYTSVRHLSQWFEDTDVVYVFKSMLGKQYAIVKIPARLNRENMTTVAYALSGILTESRHIHLSCGVSQRPVLEQLIFFLQPKAVFVPTKENADVIITGDDENIYQDIFERQLFPFVYSYKSSQKMLKNKFFNDFLSQVFSEPPILISKLDRDEKGLEAFVNDYKEEFYNLVSYKKVPEFSAQAAFLKNARVCFRLKDSSAHCSLLKDVSILQNIKNIEKSLPQNIEVEKVYLLTSDEKVTLSNMKKLKENEGLRFCYRGRSAILLPYEIKALDKAISPFYILKQKAGLNPQFDTEGMQFYKFKVKEINIHEDI